jgi:predicted alpha-1,2-mannosidase
MALVALTAACSTQSNGQSNDPASFVDPFIGTKSHGNTWPGASRPFGMIAWSPNQQISGSQNQTQPNGFRWETTETEMRGLALTHISGAGCTYGGAGDVPILPWFGPVYLSPTGNWTDDPYQGKWAEIDPNIHTNEVAEPGRYTVNFKASPTYDPNLRINADLAVSTRAGIGEFTFPAGSDAKLLFRTSTSINGSQDAQTTIDPATRTVTGWVITGGFCGRRGNGGDPNPDRRAYYILYFSAVFDQDFSNYGTWHNNDVIPGGLTVTGGEGIYSNAAAGGLGLGSGGWVGFDTTVNPLVRMRIGISYVDLAGAIANRDAEIPEGSTADSVAAEARAAWNTELGRIQIAGGTPERTTTFYTAVYHSLLMPQTINDLDGRYIGTDMQVHTMHPGQGAVYGTFSGWDVYRSQIQLIGLLRPDVAGDWATSMLDFANQNGGIWDRWLHLSAPVHVMAGDPAAPTLATWAAYGVDNFDANAAFASLVKQATVQNPDALSAIGYPGQMVAQRPGLNTYLALHYAPNDDYGTNRACSCWGGAAETLEDSIADYSLAMWAQRRQNHGLYLLFKPRGEYWQNTFNPDFPGGGWQIPRNLDGSWKSGFNPDSETGFVQGDSYTYTWMVPQNVSGLAQLMGGRNVAAYRLDTFFHNPDGSWAISDGTGHYDPGQEPGLLIPWLYNALAQPWKTQETLRQILDTKFGPDFDDIPGDDDLGTMSAWYVFAAIGLYPQVPGRAEMLLSSPMFTHVALQRSNGVLLTLNANSTDTYVQSVQFNNALHKKSWLPEKFVQKGGTVTFTLGPTPNKDWATALDQLPVDN